MCEFLSFFIHRRADKLPLAKRYVIGDLRSHSETAKLAGIKYGADGDDHAEVEWTGEHERELTVRDSRAGVLRAVLLADFPTRAAALQYALDHLPAGLTSLNLYRAEVPEKLALPAGLTSLNLAGVQVPEKLALPAGLTSLDLSYAKVPEKLALPAGLTSLNLAGVLQVPEKLALPAGCKVIR